ncbi:Periplasmic binding protein [Synechococcus sp. PCC 7335]|nr:Periplasmic binding protein [Synechococcus sp. PCC 7335]
MSIRRALRFIGLFSLVVLLCWGCGNYRTSDSSVITLTSSDCRLVDHDAGETEVCGDPEVVVALSPYILDIMLSLGEEPAGYSAADLDPAMLGQPKFDQPSQQIPYVGELMIGTPVNLGDRHNPSLEALAQLNPDLILGEAWQGELGKYELFSHIAPTVLVDDKKGGWQRTLPFLAKALNVEQQIEQINAEYDTRIEDVRQQLASVVKDHSRVLVISSGELSGAIFTYNNSEFSRLLEDLGFEVVQVAENKLSDDSVISIEALPSVETDIVMVVGWDDEVSSDIEGLKARQREWEQSPLLQRMSASEAGRVYFIDARLSTLRGPLAANAILENYLDQLSSLN